jgi:uncharacterized cupredoxin-like copper-binding protein
VIVGPIKEAPMQRSRGRLIALLAAAMLAACGGGQETDSGAPEGGAQEQTEAATEAGATEAGAAQGQTLQFVAADIEYRSAPSTASAGPATVVLENQGALEHYVVIDELDLEVEAHGGETVEGTVELQPGTYTYYCTVPGHRDAGMEGELTVT